MCFKMVRISERKNTIIPFIVWPYLWPFNNSLLTAHQLNKPESKVAFVTCIQ